MKRESEKKTPNLDVAALTSRLLQIVFVFLVSVFSLQASAYGACSGGPAGTENAGDIFYNGGTYHTLEYCDGTNWVQMGQKPLTGAGGGAGCTAIPCPIFGLVGWWKFDDAASGTSPATAADASGNGNNGINTNSPTWTSSGKIGNALGFVYASSQQVKVNDANSIQLYGSWTASTWVKFTTTPGSGSYDELLEKDNSDWSANYRLSLDNGTLVNNGLGFAVSFEYSAGNSSYAKYVPGTAITTGTWYLVTGVWDSSTNNLYLYVNGALVATQNTGAHTPELRPPTFCFWARTRMVSSTTPASTTAP